eukprot:14415-Heterococcus_DN1.PRE.1
MQNHKLCNSKTYVQAIDSPAWRVGIAMPKLIKSVELVTHSALLVCVQLSVGDQVAQCSGRV